MNKIRHFIDVQDLSRKEILDIFKLMKYLKDARYNGAVPPLLKNKTLAMIFEEPSTRTRVSFEAAMTLLGGHAQYLKPGEIHLGVRESLYDTSKVLSHMVDGIFCRSFKHETLMALGKYSDVPVFNGITDYIHPTQAICDFFTILEKVDPRKIQDNDFSKIKVVFVGDATNVMSSTMFLATQLGMHFVHIRPDKYKSSDKWNKIAIDNIKKAGSGSVKFSTKIEDVKNADVVYTDLWWWVDQEDEAEERVKEFMPYYQITPQVLDMAGKNSILMHCLPASRNIEATDQALDGPHSVIFEQAENRLTAQMALLVYFMYPRIDIATESTKEYHKGKIEAFMQGRKRPWKERYSYNNDYDKKAEVDLEAK